MQRVVIPLERLSRQLEALAHRVQDQFKSLDAWRIPVRFQPAYRRLLRAHPTGQPLLAEPVTQTRLPNQFTWSHA